MGPLDRIQRGVDSSGRPLLATRQTWQRYDRINEVLGGKLVVIQGSFNSGVTASGGTHDLAGALDFRTWNLTAAERFLGIKTGRVLGGADWYRTPAEGFDFHWHGVTIGDAPMTRETAFQVVEYRAGRNGLADRGPDDFPFRPKIIRPYRYIEDDMFNKDDSNRLKRVERLLEAQRTRDQREREQDKERFQRLVKAQGRIADRLTVLIGRTSDDATRRDLKALQAEILTALKNDPDVTGVDNPSDDALGTPGAG